MKCLDQQSAGTQLNKWLTDYAMTNIEEDKSWNLKDGIIKAL